MNRTKKPKRMDYNGSSQQSFRMSCHAIGNLRFKIPEVKDYPEVIQAFSNYMIIGKPFKKVS